MYYIVRQLKLIPVYGRRFSTLKAGAILTDASGDALLDEDGNTLTA